MNINSRNKILYVKSVSMNAKTGDIVLVCIKLSYIFVATYVCQLCAN